MRFEYCPHCGTRAVQKEIGDEGLMPWCDRCKRPLFDIFSTCIIALAVDEEGNVALLRQGYISTRHYVLVSGYIKPGESAEECAAREIGEELGLAVRGLHFTGTYWLGKKDMLMIGFVANVHREEFHLSLEVDQAVWVTPEEALTMVNAHPAISHQVVEYYVDHRESLTPSVLA